MRFSHHRLRFIVLLAVGSCAVAAVHAVAQLPAPAARKVDFVRDVRPIFAKSCAGCHGETKQKGDLRFDVRASVMNSGAIVSGKSAASPLIQRVAGLEPDKRMPPKGPALTAEQVGILRAWIDRGAVWPETVPGADRSEHWAYQPLGVVAIPPVKNPAWVRTPIDAFILAKLEAKGITPAAPADKRTLLRRVSFDLIGLPPTPEEIGEFLTDQTPNAYEKVVDRLLASPHYGERWARHWMDVIHFAETHGNDQDVPRENAWPYRDYLIRSFNRDKPYSRFVEEQIAGDVLWPDDADAIVATGFLAAGPWDESSQQSINDDTIDKKVAQYLDRDDMVTTAMGTFSGATVHCARCHNHKFDPISQAEYYALQACFAGIDRANRGYDPDPRVARARHALLKRKAELAGAREALLTQLRAPAVRAEVVAFEKAQGGRVDPWVVLDPATFVSSGGATPEKLGDLSIRFAGKRPDKDSYTVTARTTLRGITGVRLEVLTDPALPLLGPGRQDNGNLHLSEFRVQAGSSPSINKPIVLQNPVADFNQDGWTIAHAIDNSPGTAWGIYPQVGQPHQAVFEFKEPIGHDADTTLTFTLEQIHGGGHLIGRLRLSATNAPRPLRLDPLPQHIKNTLATPADNRTETQRLDLALFVVRRDVEKKVAELPAQQMVFSAANDFKPAGSFKPARGCRPIHVLRRGDINQPIEPAQPGALACVHGLPSRFESVNANDEGTRRAALANWFTDPRNVLTWRTIVNRVWHYHFGRGLTATPNDLGKMGTPPTHPELLDYLAVNFRDDGGSLKRLHKMIVTSAAYRQSSNHNAEYAKTDGDNQYLWRMNRLRLDAESVHDAVLLATGKLDRMMGGPSVKQFIQTPGIHVTPNVDYLKFDIDNPVLHRRSVYRFLFRTLPDPFMESLDCPDSSQFMPVRASSVTALQALAMLNDRFMVRQSEHFAKRVADLHPNPDRRIEAIYQRALGRAPTPKESTALAGYANKHGLANACRVIFNSNEFMFVP